MAQTAGQRGQWNTWLNVHGCKQTNATASKQPPHPRPHPPWCYVRDCAGMDRETQSQRAAAEACWKIEHTTFMLLGPFLSKLHRMLTWMLATCFRKKAVVHSGVVLYIVYTVIHIVQQFGTGLIFKLKRCCSLTFRLQFHVRPLVALSMMMSCSSF